MVRETFRRVDAHVEVVRSAAPHLTLRLKIMNSQFGESRIPSRPDADYAILAVRPHRVEYLNHRADVGDLGSCRSAGHQIGFAAFDACNTRLVRRQRSTESSPAKLVMRARLDLRSRHIDVREAVLAD